jgi:hypothetical protein
VAVIGAGTTIVVTLINRGSSEQSRQTNSARGKQASVEARTAGLSLVGSEDVRTSATSRLPNSGDITYDPANTVDGDAQTAWSEGRPGPGVGETLTYRFTRPINLRRIVVLNGYAKSNELFERNARVRVANIETGQGVRTANLRDTKSPQRLTFASGRTNFVKLTIERVYPGTRYADTLISEVEFYAQS